MGVPVPKRGGRVASLSSIRSTVLRNSYEYRRPSNHRAQLAGEKGVNTLSQSDWCDWCYSLAKIMLTGIFPAKIWADFD